MAILFPCPLERAMMLITSTLMAEAEMRNLLGCILVHAAVISVHLQRFLISAATSSAGIIPEIPPYFGKTS